MPDTASARSLFSRAVANHMKKQRVVVGMSGGVDSAVAAALLCEQGYDVVGVTIKTYNYEDVGGNAANESSCCSLEGINDARAVARQLGFPHYVVDLTVPFAEHVIDPFVQAYLHGTTPNPCVQCNRHIKWRAMLRKADALGAAFLATGHYARVERTNGGVALLKGVDGAKDQSYTLWNVALDDLARTIFPLGGMTKSEVRAAAERFKLPVAQKHESFEICFVTDNNYARFLREAQPGLVDRVAHGTLKYNETIVGEHEGYPFYTIGQRRGIQYSAGKPVYVVRIDAASNTVILGDDEELMHREFVARDINLLVDLPVNTERRVTAKIRAHDEGALATIIRIDDTTVRTTFDEPRRAITPGQSVVWFDGEKVIGGGVIC